VPPRHGQICSFDWHPVIAVRKGTTGAAAVGWDAGAIADVGAIAGGAFVGDVPAPSEEAISGGGASVELAVSDDDAGSVEELPPRDIILFSALS